jgi:CUG-BP- and ETR3-like factor
MNGPPDRVDFKPMGPHHGGSFRPMGFAYDDGFRPMGPNGGVGGEGTRSIVGARYNYPAKYPPSESPDRRRFIGKAMESDYSVRPTTPPVQQPLSGQKRGYPISDHGSFTGTGKHEFTLLSSMYIYSCSLLRFLSVSYFCGNQ